MYDPDFTESVPNCWISCSIRGKVLTKCYIKYHTLVSQERPLPANSFDNHTTFIQDCYYVLPLGHPLDFSWRLSVSKKEKQKLKASNLDKQKVHNQSVSAGFALSPGLSVASDYRHSSLLDNDCIMRHVMGVLRVRRRHRQHS